MKVFSQKLTKKARNTEYELPSHHITLLNPCPKFFEVEFRSLPSGQNVLDAENPVALDDLDRQNRLIRSSLMFPLLIKKNTKVLGQLGYNQERFNPWTVEQPSLSMAPFIMKQASFTAIVHHKLPKDRFVIGFLRSAIKSDELNFDGFGRKSSNMAGFILGKTNYKGNKIGVGIAGGVNLGRTVISPTILFEGQIGRRWFLDATLPKEVNLRYAVSGNTYINSGVSIQSGSYLIHTSVFEDLDEIEYRRASVNLNLGVEHYLNEWVGISFFGGLTSPVNNIFVEPGDRSADALWDANQRLQPFFSATFFAVIPRKFLKKAL